MITPSFSSHIMKVYKAIGKGNLLVINQRTLAKVFVHQIIMLKGEVNYTTIHLEGGKTKVIARPLKFFEEYLKLQGFLRVHRSFLINPKHVTEWNINSQCLLMKDGTTVAIARRRKDVCTS